jgi:hypothetical protein
MIVETWVIVLTWLSLLQVPDLAKAFAEAGILGSADFPKSVFASREDVDATHHFTAIPNKGFLPLSRLAKDTSMPG